MKIEHLSSISAIYYALLHNGYEFYPFERNQDTIGIIKGYVDNDAAFPYFSQVRQNTCDVYPYWPRAFILEKAAFYLEKDSSGFCNYNLLKDEVMSANNITQDEKSVSLWSWINGFPKALKEVIGSADFNRYWKWEDEWVSEQNERYDKEIGMIDRLLDHCRTEYHPYCHGIRMILCPIKCVYASDYHICDGTFIFTSGDLRSDSVIHEYLHTIIHPIIEKEIKQVPVKQYQGIDNSYYFDRSEQGYKNAFEEYAVRLVTDRILKKERLPELYDFLHKLTIR